MDIQDKILQKVKTDKILHILCGALIAAFMPSWWISLSAALLLGIGKEVFDVAIRKTKWDTLDLCATFLGGVVATGLNLLRGYLSI